MEDDASESLGDGKADPLRKKYLDMMLQVARLYAAVENYDAAFTHLNSAVTNAGFSDVKILSRPVADGGFLEVGEASGEKSWFPLAEQVKKNAAAEKEKKK